MISRRLIIASLMYFALALSVAAPARAADKVIRVGTLKLIHTLTPYFYNRFAPPGYKVEVIPFETPTDAKNAVVSKSVDFGVYGLSAATMGAAMGEPVVVIAPSCNRGMAIVVKKGEHIDSFKQLKGKRIGILPGTTQESVFFERLKEEGMSIKDVHPVRVEFSEMASALARGDIDAYLGAEPGPTISVLRGVGKVLEYPYGTPMGSVNIVLTTRADTVKNDPELVKLILNLHRKASEYAMSHREELAKIASAKLGLSTTVAIKAADNVEFTWKADPAWVKESKYYGSLMLRQKQIRKLPDYNTFFAFTPGPKS